MRELIKRELKSAVELGSHSTRLSMLRLINTAIEDKDKSLRAATQSEGISDGEIRAIISTMLRQRQKSVTKYEEDGRLDLAEAERQEVAVLTDLLPKPLNSADIDRAVAQAIKKTGANQIRHKGRVMQDLKTRYPDQMNFKWVSDRVEALLDCHRDPP